MDDFSEYEPDDQGPEWDQFEISPDLSGVKPTAYQVADLASMEAGRGKALTGMEPGTELTAQLYTPLVQHPFRTASQLVAAPFMAAGGAIATGLNLLNPETWVPEEQKTDKVFGESPEQRTERHAEEQFAPGKPIWTPTGTAIDPQGSDLARLMSQWSTPEQVAMLPAGMTPIGAAAMIAQMVPQVAEQIYQAAKGEGSEEEKRDRINNLFSMGVLIAHGKAGGEGRVGKQVKEAVADVRGRLDLPRQEREAFAGRDWTQEIDYDALSRDMAVPGAQVMQRPSVVPPEGVVFPVGQMERIAPPAPPRPAVPGTAPQPREHVIGEIRRRGLKTINQILDVFPSLEGHREKARQLRDTAWGKPEGGPGAVPPPASTPVPPPPGPAPTAPEGASEITRQPIRNTNEAYKVAMTVKTIADLEALRAMRLQRAAQQKQMLAAVEKATDPMEKIRLMNAAQMIGGQYPREAIEAATNTGSAVEGEGQFPTKLGKRPLDWRHNPEVAAWLKAHAAELQIALPDELKAPEEAAAKPAEAAAEPTAAAAPGAPAPGGALIDVPKAAKPLEAERQQIVRLLQRLEHEDEREWLSQKDRLTPKEGKEDTVARLRKRLGEIETQLAAGGTKAPEPAAEAPKPETKPPETATPARPESKSPEVAKLEAAMDRARELRDAQPQRSSRWNKANMAYRTAYLRWKNATSAAPEAPEAPTPRTAASPASQEAPAPVQTPPGAAEPAKPAVAPAPPEDERAGLAGELDAELGQTTPPAAAPVKEVEKRRSGAAGQVLGFGGAVGMARPSSSPAAAGPPASTPAQLAAVITRATPGLTLGRRIAGGLQSLLLPSMKGPAYLHAAEMLGAPIGRMHQRAESARQQLQKPSRLFDRMGLERKGVQPKNNPGTRFRSDVSQGRPLAPPLQAIADTIDRLFKERLDKLEEASAALRTVRENYFPGIWTMESRLAFNLALQDAIARGIIPKDLDLNGATPAQRDAVRALTDQYLKERKGSETDMLPYLSRKPLAGRESFRKQKVFDDIMHAEEFGLVPVSYNPIDLVKVKLAELDRSVMMHEYMQALKEAKELKIINPYEEIPEGWEKLNDKYGTIYGKPTVTIPEYLDKTVYEGMLKVAAALGIKHERLMRFPPGPGNQALGLSYQGQNRILSRFGTETSVIAHEIGHQLDHKYGLWDFLTGGERGSERNSVAQRELRAIADETERGKNARKKEEKMAQVMEAYIHAPDRMKQIAPTIYAKFDAFVKATPELKAFADIKPGLALQQLAGEKYVGLPIMGYRIVPKEHGAIINNYLSSSLYNNPYLGDLYKGWIGTANALNQTQLGMGSAFHAGFTTIESLVSSGANVLKDIYGVLRGNRTVGDLAATTGNSIISIGRNPVMGERVLNAWRETSGTVSPRIAAVVEAAKLAGGGFKMERGLQTDQLTKMVRNWYSGEPIKAAARAPVAFTELLAKPIMEMLVPRQKAGVFADMVWRLIEMNPNKSMEELTPEFRQAWNRVDARLGQVRYDRLFMRNTAKNLFQAFVRAPGWSGGTITEIGGGFTDAGRFLAEFAKTGKLPENLPDRTAYVLSLMSGVMTANGLLTYAFTGAMPSGMDFFAFRTGQKDEHGNEERFVLPSYVKDMLAYARHPIETLSNKSHPILGIIGDLSRNKDYYGVEIRHRGDPALSQAGETVGYVVKAWEPFWTRGLRRERARGAGAARQIAPFFGVMPAPRSVTESTAEGLAHDLMLEQIPPGPRTAAQVARSRATAAARPHQPYLESTVGRLSAEHAVLVFEKANAEERKRIAGLVNDRIARSRVLSDQDKAALSRRLNR